MDASLSKVLGERNALLIHILKSHRHIVTIPAPFSTLDQYLAAFPAALEQLSGEQVLESLNKGSKITLPTINNDEMAAYLHSSSAQHHHSHHHNNNSGGEASPSAPPARALPTPPPRKK